MAYNFKTDLTSCHEGNALASSTLNRGVQLVSLGSACATKMAFDEIGRKQASLPFDYTMTLIEGIIGFLTNDFIGFFDFTSTECFEVGAADVTVYRNAAHSWWHDDPTDPATREKFVRRINRLKGIQAHNTPVLFVRVAATTDELAKAHTLLQVLLQKFGAQAKLLLIIPSQYAPALGPHLIDGIPNLLVYCLGLANYGEAVSAALLWISGQLLDCKRSRSLTAIEGLSPAHTGFYGMGGRPAFENTPDYVPVPPVQAVNVRPNPKAPGGKVVEGTVAGSKAMAKSSHQAVEDFQASRERARIQALQMEHSAMRQQGIPMPMHMQRQVVQQPMPMHMRQQGIPMHRAHTTMWP